MRGSSRDRWRLGPQAKPPSGWRDTVTPGESSPRNRSRVDRRCVREKRSSNRPHPGPLPFREREQHTTADVPIRFAGSPITQCLDLRGHHLTARHRFTHRWTTSFLGAQPSGGSLCRLPDASRRLLAADPAHHRRLPREPPAAKRPVSASDRYLIRYHRRDDNSTEKRGEAGRSPLTPTHPLLL
jgi:hypothetical protein